MPRFGKPTANPSGLKNVQKMRKTFFAASGKTIETAEDGKKCPRSGRRLSVLYQNAEPKKLTRRTECEKVLLIGILYSFRSEILFLYSYCIPFQFLFERSSPPTQHSSPALARSPASFLFSVPTSVLRRRKTSRVLPTPPPPPSPYRFGFNFLFSLLPPENSARRGNGVNEETPVTCSDPRTKSESKRTPWRSRPRGENAQTGTGKANGKSPGKRKSLRVWGIPVGKRRRIGSYENQSRRTCPPSSRNVGVSRKWPKIYQNGKAPSLTKGGTGEKPFETRKSSGKSGFLLILFAMRERFLSRLKRTRCRNRETNSFPENCS